MKTSACVWHCNYCGTSIYSEEEANSHYRSHRGKSAPRPGIYVKCDDCKKWFTSLESITHHCDKAGQRRASAGCGPVIAAVVIVAAIAWIIGRMMI